MTRAYMRACWTCAGKRVSYYWNTAVRVVVLHYSLVLTSSFLVDDLETLRSELSTKNEQLSEQLETVKAQLHSANFTLDDTQRTHAIEIDDLRRGHRNEMEDSRDQNRREMDRLHRSAQEDADRLRKDAQDEIEKLLKSHRDNVSALEQSLKAELDAERDRRIREVQEMSTQLALERQNTSQDKDQRDQETQSMRNDMAQLNADLGSQRTLNSNLQDKLSEASANALSLETSMRAMKAKIDFLESDNQAQSQAFADLNQRMQEAIESASIANEKLRAEESLRRKLHNQVQELKGNIRVFCRVRPIQDDEMEDAAKITFPDMETDSKEVVVQGPETKSAMGNVTTSSNTFSFDRVFGASSQNSDVFEEISQLIQSALDGYNVCIFCYGQTGSGKTYTMSSLDGMIPCAVKQIYETAQSLEEKGWKYTMHGSFIEVYNEQLNDLLGRAEDLDKKKHEIRHDTAKKQTTITDVCIVPLDKPEMVEDILERASRNRSVAATKANQRSSRSHSVFILKLVGENSITGERSEGTLNLVDLAGSERLSHSGATGERLKETQNINRSLSCLGDVIAALGQGKEGGHVPYRNSKVSRLPRAPTCATDS